MNDPILWTALFTIGGGLLAFDLWSHRGGGTVSLRESVVWTVFYILAAVAFGVLVYAMRGSEDAAKYFTGYALEKVLSLDNVMVFGVIFAYFGVAPEHRHAILHWGILGAVVLRLLFAFVGVEMIEFMGAPMLFAFAAVVFWSVWKIWKEIREGDDGEPVDYENEWYIRWTKRVLGDRVTHDIHGGKIFVKLDGRWVATPLFMCLVAIEISDVMFALDSIPAIIAVTQDKLLVYSAMMFAILGLRALFFFLDALLARLEKLQYALLIVLAWIGVKMVGQGFEAATDGAYGFHIDPLVSLTFVLGTLTAGVVWSLATTRSE